MARRKGTRYLRVLRGSNEAARNKLISYFKGEIDVEYPERQGDRPARAAAWVTPFGIPLTAGAKLRQQIRGTGNSTAIGFANGFVTLAAPAEDDRVVLPGLLAPRAAITTGRTNTGTANTSKLTGLRYKSYGGSTISVPFGEGSGADDKSEDAVFRKIQTAVKAANPLNLCSFVPGSYSV